MTIWHRLPYTKIVASCALLLLTACANAPKQTNIPLQQCQSQLQLMQQKIKAANVQDAQYHPVDKFSVYRSNRFWSSFVGTTEAESADYFLREQLHQLGMSSLRMEWNNLPLPEKQAFDQFRDQCDSLLWHASLEKPLTKKQAEIDDSYSTTQRILGLYVLSKKLAAPSVAEYQTEMRDLIEGFNQDKLKSVRHYKPKVEYGKSTGALSSKWLKVARASNPLNIPILTEEQLTQLASWHSPQFRIGQKSPADKIGKAEWQHGERTINRSQPTVYFNPSYIRYGDALLLQLNYTAWFSERPKPTPKDWYGGKLDGLIWRVTLQESGEVLFYDSIHPCGCYHSVHIPKGSPLSKAVKNLPTQQQEPIMFFDAAIQTQQPQPLLTLTADEHYLVNVSKSTSSSGHAYQLYNHDQLRSMPYSNGYKSWFDPDGLIHSSQRFERYFLWPLGVPSAGAMRQQGNHAIAFIGKRHFDEARVEQLLNLPP